MSLGCAPCVCSASSVSGPIDLGPLFLDGERARLGGSGAVSYCHSLLGREVEQEQWFHGRF